ncbi:MAG: C10 family peptidase [Chitinivibrionales bacterium]
MSLKSCVTVMLVLVFTALSTFAIDGHSSEVQARSFCQNWIDEQGGRRSIHSLSQLTQKPTGAIFLARLSPSGYLLVQIANDTSSLIGFSTTSPFQTDASNPVTEGLIGVIPDGKRSQAALSKSRSAESVEPLTTALWNQEDGFNVACPMDARAENGFSLAGCSGTSLAILLHYWQYPKKGSGSNTYVDDLYGEIAVNYEETAYQWDDMSLTSPDVDNTQLLFHCAVAVNTIFGPVESNSPSLEYKTYALRHYFGYNPGLYGMRRSEMSDAQWKALIKQQLDEGKPVLYFGSNELRTGHGFVIDGYAGDLFHINWGWGGNANGFFDLDNLNHTTINYNHFQHAHFDVFPASIQPVKALKASLNQTETEVSLSWEFSAQQRALEYFTLTYRLQGERYNYKYPQRATLFSPEDFTMAVPCTLRAVGHSFYVTENQPPDSQFTYIIYDADGVTPLYESPTLTAHHNNEIKHTLSQPLQIDDDFYVAIAPENATSGYPASNSTMVPKSSCHSVHGSAGAWNEYNYAPPGGRELHTSVFIDGTPQSGHFPRGGYIVLKNGSPIDTIESLETNEYIDTNLIGEKATYSLITFMDTLAHQSAPADTVTVAFTGTHTRFSGKDTQPGYRLVDGNMHLTLNHPSPVQIRLYDCRGVEILEICEKSVPRGVHRYSLAEHSRKMPPAGVYLLKVRIGNHTCTPGMLTHF